MTANAPATLTEAVEAAVGPLDQLDPATAHEVAGQLRAILDALPASTPADLRLAADLSTVAALIASP